jgi:hypothetical protein
MASGGYRASCVGSRLSRVVEKLQLSIHRAEGQAPIRRPGFRGADRAPVASAFTGCPDRRRPRPARIATGRGGVVERPVASRSALLPRRVLLGGGPPLMTRREAGLAFPWEEVGTALGAASGLRGGSRRDLQVERLPGARTGSDRAGRRHRQGRFHVKHTRKGSRPGGRLLRFGSPWPGEEAARP